MMVRVVVLRRVHDLVVVHAGWTRAGAALTVDAWTERRQVVRRDVVQVVWVRVGQF